MNRTQTFATAAVVALVVAATTWPFRSEHLISWDAANFAFALQRIDIAAHRPHPPGYLGYVFAGRALDVFFHDANAALTAWNVIVRSLGALLLALWAFDATRGSMRAAIAATAVFCSSPLVWFYASNAEIYPSEMVLALAVVYATSRSIAGNRPAMYWAAALLGLAALFKISAMVLLLPVALYAWSSWPSKERVRTAGLFFAIFGAVAVMFLTIQPDVLQLLWQQFNGATAPSRLGGTTANMGRTLNRNLRDTAVNLLAALGVVNGVAFLVWMLRSRRLPDAIDGRLIALGTIPWLVLLVFVHIGNPGYVLPLIPVLCLILGAWYARLSTNTFSALVLLQAVANIAQVALLVPPAVESAPLKYSEKTTMQKLASDLTPLSFPTLATVRRSDAAIDRLLGVTSACQDGPWVVVATGEPVDWRRASYYLPAATTIGAAAGGKPEAIAQGGEAVALRGDQRIVSACGLIWLTTDATQSKGLPAGGRQIPELGWIWPPGSGSASPSGLTWGP